MVGKRTYAIRVVGDWRDVPAGGGGVDGLAGVVASSEPVRGMGLPEPVTVDGVDYAALAVELLLAAGQALAANGGAADDDTKRRLAVALEAGQTAEKKYRDMRDKVEVVGDELAAVKQERDALRARVRGLESNVQAAIRAAQAAGASKRGEALAALQQVEAFISKQPSRR